MNHEWLRYFRDKSRAEKIKKRMAAIPGEPCGGILYQCSHSDRHINYHCLLRELNDLQKGCYID